MYAIRSYYEELTEKGTDVKVRWFYPQDDEDLQEAGEDFESMVELNFEFVPYDDEPEGLKGGSASSLIDSLL